MNLNSACFYAYVFFKVPPALNREGDPAADFFRQWKTLLAMEEKDPLNIGDTDLKMLRLAEKDTVQISLFRFRNTDIVKFRKHRTEPTEAISSLWEKSAAEFESQIGNIAQALSFIGISRVYFAHSSDLSKNAAKMVAKYCQWEIDEEMPSVKVSSLGTLYGISDQSYLMLSQYGDPSAFLDKDFAVIESVFQKTDFENRRFNEVRIQIEKSENQIQKLISPADIEEIEVNLTAIRTYQCHLHDSRSMMAKLEQTLDMGVMDINNYLSAYTPQNDMLFVSKLGKIEKIQKRVRFDLNYVNLISTNIDSRIRILLLTTQTRRLNTERRIQTLIAAFGTAIIVGLSASEVCCWTLKLLLMGLSASVAAVLSYYFPVSLGKD